VLGTPTRRPASRSSISSSISRQKGTGKWASQTRWIWRRHPHHQRGARGAHPLGARDERIAASKILKGPAAVRGDRDAFIEALRQALRLAIVTCLRAGVRADARGSKEYGYHLHFSEIARSWKGGCIIRAKLLEPIKQAFLENPDLVNLLVDSRFSALANELQGSLRTVVTRAPGLGVPVLRSPRRSTHRPPIAPAHAATCCKPSATISARTPMSGWIAAAEVSYSLARLRRTECPTDSTSLPKAPGLVSVGALVHRLDPGIIPFRKATQCQIHVSGGEFNVAANLADCFRLRTGHRHRHGGLSIAT